MKQKRKVNVVRTLQKGGDMMVEDKEWNLQRAKLTSGKSYGKRRK